MKKLIVIGLIIVNLIFACKRESENKNCSDNKYYCSLLINGKSTCFSFCESSLVEENNNGNLEFYISMVSGKVISQTTDTVKLFPAIYISLPDTLIKTYNNENRNDSNFSFTFVDEPGNYFYPFNGNLSGNENFELTINELDLDNNSISGTFHGKIYNNVSSDFITIENGNFKGKISRQKK